MASARLASVKRRKRRDIQRNVRELNFLLLEDKSEEEIYTEIADIVLNAGGFDRDAEVELDTAVVMETDKIAENFEDNCSDINDIKVMYFLNHYIVSFITNHQIFTQIFVPTSSKNLNTSKFI